MYSPLTYEKQIEYMREEKHYKTHKIERTLDLKPHIEKITERNKKFVSLDTSVLNRERTEIASLPFGAYYSVPDIIMGLPNPGRLPVILPEKRLSLAVPIFCPAVLYYYRLEFTSAIASYIYSHVSSGDAVQVMFYSCGGNQGSGKVYIEYAMYDSTQDDLMDVLEKIGTDACYRVVSSNMGGMSYNSQYWAAKFISEKMDTGLGTHFLPEIHVTEWQCTPALVKQFVEDAISKEFRVGDVLNLYGEIQ